MPIPLAGKSGAWYFGRQSGKNEILSQRIGKNEQVAAWACRELFDAQNLYYMLGHQSDSVHPFALRFISQEDDHTGPLDPRIASAGVEACAKGRTQRAASVSRVLLPYPDGSGRLRARRCEDYVVNGQMTGGFAFLAYPAKYGSSGVMTFMISQDGTVYRRDLGARVRRRRRHAPAASAPQAAPPIHGPRSIDQDLARLTKDLQLTAEQQIRPLLQEHHDKIHAISKETHRQIEHC
jgi:hypothetical protein